ncbi:MAG: hypothetical protein JXJ04_04995 [Spirochaetales bacterium]|nr:hypothetical protein [Spirochaetales bacterium]
MKKIVIVTCLIIPLISVIGCKSAPPEVVIIEATPLSTPLPTPVPTPTVEKPYYIEILPSLTDKDYTINPYSFIHSFYSMVFYDFRLTTLIPLEERKEIMKTVYDEILLGSQVNFIIKKYMDVDKLSFVFYTFSSRQGLICELKTNFDEGAEVLVPLDMPKEEWKRCVSINYQLINTKLVHKSEMYSFAAEQNLLENNDFVELAHLYIFDEKEENDDQIREILDKIIRRNSGNDLGIKARLELVFFYLLNNDISSAEIIMSQINQLMPEEAGSTLYTDFIITNEEMEILKTILVRF